MGEASGRGGLCVYGQIQQTKAEMRRLEKVSGQGVGVGEVKVEPNIKRARAEIAGWSCLAVCVYGQVRDGWR